MDERRFTKLAKLAVCSYINEYVFKKDDHPITPDDLFVVWECKILQNNKILISSNLPDFMYYEVTYNGDKKEMYLDSYKKFENKWIKVSEE